MVAAVVVMPFTWNGLFGLWIPLIGFGGWSALGWFLLRKAILTEHGSEQEQACDSSNEIKAFFWQQLTPGSGAANTRHCKVTVTT